MRHFSLLCICFTLLLPACLFAQDLTILTDDTDEKSEIIAAIEAYLDATKAEDYSRSLDYVHPGLFEFAQREAVEANLKNMEAGDYNMTIDSTAILDISKILVVDSVKYAVVDYYLKMKFQFEKSEDGDSDLMNIMRGMFESQYGAEHLWVNEEKREISIRGFNRLFAIGDPELDGWKLLEFKGTQAFILDAIIPFQVQTYFKS